VTQKIGDFYASCIDEAGIEKSDWIPSSRNWRRSRDETPCANWRRLWHGLQMVTGGYSPFSSGAGRTRIRTIRGGDSIAGSSGLGLPDRDYYTKEDAKSKETRERYVQHDRSYSNCLATTRDSQEERGDADAHGNSAGKGFDDTCGRRDPYKLKNKMKIPAGRAGTEFRLEDVLQRFAVPKIEVLMWEFRRFSSR